MRISDWSSDVCSSDLTTTSNAWGTIAVRKFAQSYPATAITGTTTLALGARSVSRAWPLAADQRAISLPLPPAQTPLMLRQRSEEHTSELQSLMRISYAVFCLKKKKIKILIQTHSASDIITHASKRQNQLETH